MNQRIDLEHLAGGPLAGMVRVEERIELDDTVRHLIKIRASQLNGCAYCLDMHWTHAREGGETELRLSQVATWRESPFFSDRERAALELCEAMTFIAGTGVPDEVWNAAAEHFDADELANLVFAIGAINLWNRVAVTSRRVPDSFVA